MADKDNNLQQKAIITFGVDYTNKLTQCIVNTIIYIRNTYTQRRVYFYVNTGINAYRYIWQVNTLY